MRTKNTIEITTEMYVHGFFQTDVLINFFIPLRRAKAITWGYFVLVKRDPGNSKDAGMNLITCNCKIYKL